MPTARAEFTLSLAEGLSRFGGSRNVWLDAGSVVEIQPIRALTIRAKESAFKLAPPTKAPSISGLDSNESTLSAVTLPP